VSRLSAASSLPSQWDDSLRVLSAKPLEVSKQTYNCRFSYAPRARSFNRFTSLTRLPSKCAHLLVASKELENLTRREASAVHVVVFLSPS
jgi:hypothetical protein